MNATERSAAPTPLADAAPVMGPDTPIVAPADLAPLLQRFHAALHGTNPASRDGEALPTSPQNFPGSLLTEAFSSAAHPQREPALAPAPTDATPESPDTPAGLADELPAQPIAARRESSDREFPGGSATPGDPEANTLGAAMLQSLVLQGTSTAGTNQVVAAAPAPSVESLVAETVSRVLVSDPLHDGRREVRIELAIDTMPDTAVRLWRDAGRLQVEFVTSANVAEQSGLREALPRLGEAIQQRTAEPFTPQVALKLQEGASGGHGDGRSRQQYVPVEENEDSA